MQVLVMTLQFILAISILVIIHELGHFLFARLFKVRVEKFFLFMDAWNFKLFSKTIKGTEYGIGWLPLGGYVKLSGMIDESMDKTVMNTAPEPWEFRSKPVWQRLLIMIGGVLFNVILGVFICAGLLLFSDKSYLPNQELKTGIYSYELGRKMGLQTGDKILALNGHSFTRFSDLQSSQFYLGGTLLIERNGQEQTLKIPTTIVSKASQGDMLNFMGPDNYPVTIAKVLPGSVAEKGGLQTGDQIIKIDSQAISVFGNLKEFMKNNHNRVAAFSLNRNGNMIQKNISLDSSGALGILNKQQYNLASYTVLSSLRYGAADAYEVLRSNIVGFKLIFSGQISARKSMAGPIGIAKIYGGYWDWVRFWHITAILSLALALMNILPIPVLDGGHVVLLLAELVTGAAIPEKYVYRYQIVGFILIAALMLFVFGNDIINLM